jgi:WD40 repeat protein
MNIDQPAHVATAMAMSPDGTLLLAAEKSLAASGAAQNQGSNTAPGKPAVRLWDLVNGRQLSTFIVNDLRAIASVSISPDGGYALIGGTPLANRASLGLWDLRLGTQIRTLPIEKNAVFCTAFSPDGTVLMATHGTTVSLFNAETGTLRQQFDAGYQAYFLAPPPRLAAAFTPDGRYILTGGTDAALKLWDVESGKKVQSFVGHERGRLGGITGIAISSDNQFAFTSAASDASVRLWDIATGKQIGRFSGVNNFRSGAWGTALSPDNTSAFVAATQPAVWDLASGKPITPLRWDRPKTTGLAEEQPPTGLFHPNGKTLVVAADDAAVRLFDPATGRMQAMLVGFADGEWIVITSEGYYNGSEKGARYLTTGGVGSSYPVELFSDVFYRPDIVMATLRGEDTRNLATMTMSEAVHNPPPTVDFAATPGTTDQEKITICYQAKSTGGGIGEVRLFHNGKLIRSDGFYREMVKSTAENPPLMAMNGPAIYEQMRSVSVHSQDKIAPQTSKEKGANFSDCAEVATVAGDNEVGITAFNAANTVESSLKTLKFQAQRPVENPHLYILAIGINKYREKAINLKYAAKDAGDIEQKLRRQAATIYPAANVHYELLVNDKADKASIENMVNALSAKIKPEDGFILFAAGHGILLQNQYYMLTSNYDGTIRDTSSNEIVDISKKIQSLNQLFIFDACHAGGVDAIVGGLYDARMSVLAKKMGLHIYASASSVQEALDGYKGNGLFTHTLLDGLNNKLEADVNHDRTVSLAELGDFARQKTAAIARKIGYHQTPLIINYGKDNPVYKMQ